MGICPFKWFNSFIVPAKITLLSICSSIKQSQGNLQILRKTICLDVIQIMIEEIKAENKKLKELQQSCEEQLQKLKQTGKAHQTQIDTLLKFNERLLGIIQNEFNSATKNKITSDLQIISEINEGTNDYSSAKLANKLSAPPQMKGNFQQQDLQGFEDEQEEQIYNKQMMQSPQSSPVQQPSAPPKNDKIQYLLPKPDTIKTTKLDRVYEMHHNKDEEVSINLTNSLKTNQAQSLHSLSKKQAPQNNGETQPELQQLKDMIKEYRQQFVDNSSEYQQICEIIHNDLLNDLQQFKRIEQQSKRFYQTKISQVNSLRHEIKRFKPINQLLRIMKKVNVPAQTERLLTQKIISKYQ